MQACQKYDFRVLLRWHVHGRVGGVASRCRRGCTRFFGRVRADLQCSWLCTRSIVSLPLAYECGLRAVSFPFHRSWRGRDIAAVLPAARTSWRHARRKRHLLAVPPRAPYIHRRLCCRCWQRRQNVAAAISNDVPLVRSFPRCLDRGR